MAALGIPLGFFSHLHDFFPWNTPREILAMRVFDMNIYDVCEFLDGANLEFRPARTRTAYLFHDWRPLWHTDLYALHAFALDPGFPLLFSQHSRRWSAARCDPPAANDPA